MSRRRQSGVALLAAVLVVALATVLIAAMLDRGEDSRARTRNHLRAEQTFQLAVGAEWWVQSVLRRDQQQSGDVDAAGDVWAQPIPPLPVPGGLLHGRLRDASGCFNVNNLASEGVLQELQLQRLGRLLRALKLDPRLADVIADWIDADSVPRLAGAEDGHYLSQRPAGRAANRWIAHISELRLLPGVDAGVYRTLSPHLCAVPGNAEPLNLNFASPALWMSLDEGISENLARQMWRDGQARFVSLEAVQSELQELGVTLLRTEGLATSSRYFVLDAEIEVDGLPFQYSSLLRRDERGIHTLARVRGRW